MNINTVQLILHTWIEIGAWDVELLVGKKWGHEDVDAMGSLGCWRTKFEKKDCEHVYVYIQYKYRLFGEICEYVVIGGLLRVDIDMLMGQI
jgi:hypothetical protein